MDEFGHFHGSTAGRCFIDAWGAGPYIIIVDGKSFRFEDSDRFGPHRLKADGDPTARNFGESSKFWEAWRLWVSQGRRIQKDGRTCLWHSPKPQITQRIGNMHFTIQKGEPNAYGGIKQITVEAPKRPRKGRPPREDV